MLTIVGILLLITGIITYILKTVLKDNRYFLWTTNKRSFNAPLLKMEVDPPKATF